jgi:Pyruvate/2-oxoacid:ferredoxin oxidoreductase delta subunit
VEMQGSERRIRVKMKVEKLGAEGRRKTGDWTGHPVDGGSKCVRNMLCMLYFRDLQCVLLQL